MTRPSTSSQPTIPALLDPVAAPRVPDRSGEEDGGQEEKDHVLHRKTSEWPSGATRRAKTDGPATHASINRSRRTWGAEGSPRRRYVSRADWRLVTRSAAMEKTSQARPVLSAISSEARVATRPKTAPIVNTKAIFASVH